MGGVLARLSPPRFNPERDIPDLSGKVILVTGGNTGIGYETVKQLLLKNATVYFAARSPEKGNAAVERLKQETNGKEAVFLELDLADLGGVKGAADTFLGKESKLDILINNAGVMGCPSDLLTKQGYDMQFGTNLIGHYLLTLLLLPAMRSAATDIVPARVIHLTSAVHGMAPGRGVDFASVKDGEERKAWVEKNNSSMRPWRLYGQSKLGNIILANYFAKNYADVLVSCSVHPGSIRSELMRHSANWMQTLSGYFLLPTPLGAITQLWAATVATPTEINGEYLVPWGRVAKADKRASDIKLEAEVMEYLNEAVKEYM